MSEAITASCECGSLEFSSEQPPVLQLVCHCTDCRAATGRPFSRIAFFKKDGVSVTGQADDGRHVFQAASGQQTRRAVCAQCGTVMFDLSDGFPGLIGVMARRIHAPFEFKAFCHVWTSSKTPDADIPDTARQFPENIER